MPRRLADVGLVAVSLLDVWVQVDADERVGLVCALVASVALLLRRRAPLTVFVLTVPAVIASWAVYAALIALYTLAASTRNRFLLAGCAATFAAATMTPRPLPALDLMAHTSTLVAFAYGLATAAAPVLLGQLVLARRDLAARLTDITEARAHEEHLTAQTVLAKERAQLAREMHDVVSHQVSLIAVRAGALQVRSPDPDTKQAAATIRQLSVRTLEELRYMVNVLRASGSRPTELTPQPTLAQLPGLVANSAIDARLELGVPADADLPPPVQRAIYRTVQEGLTNVRKHAPGSTATVRISQHSRVIRATVVNTPPTRPAMPLPSANHGLAGLRQRAALLGGTLEASPTPDRGFRLSLALPITGPNR